MVRIKLTISIVIILIVIVIGFLRFKVLAEKYRNTHCLITQLSSRFLDLNTINVNVTGELKKNDFKIKNLNSGKFVFENGRTYKRMKNEYGYCRFEIYYKDTLIYELEHLKTNNWNTYDYSFLFEKINDKINVTLNKMGPDDEQFGQISYKQFIRNDLGKVVKVKYIDHKKKTYREELLN